MPEGWDMDSLAGGHAHSPTEPAPNEQIEHFKRFAAAHMRWVNFSFDRIVSEAVKRHARPDRVSTDARQQGE